MTEPVDLDAVRRARAGGEPEHVQFDAAVHPGVVYRLYALGRGHEDVAAALGITVAELDVWLELHPEMVSARTRAVARDAEILQSIEDHALGVKDPETGRYTGGNASLLRFLGRARLGMVEAKAPPTEEERFDGLSPEQLKREALVLKRRLSKVEGLAQG